MQKKNGFTLIELMIVLAILGIIGSLVFGAIAGRQQEPNEIDEDAPGEINEEAR